MKTEASSDDNIDKENENVVDNAIEIKQEIDDEDNHKKTKRSSNISSTNQSTAKSPKNSAKRKRGSAQCSKIGKKCNFKSAKKHYLHFQKWQKINFCPQKV